MRIRNWQWGLTVTSVLALSFFSTCKRPNTDRSSNNGNSSGSSISSGDPEAGFSLVGNPIQGVGPADPYHGFPRWYEDSTGVRVELCHDVDARCILPPFDTTIPSRFPENFPDESFYWTAGNTLAISTGGTIRAEYAIEAAFILGDPMPGQRITFGRTRFIAKGLTNGTYRITHPYGVDEFDVVDGTIKYTDDIGVGQESFTGVFKAPFGTLLSWDAGAPAGYLGDAAVLHTFKGSPYGTNFYKVEVLNGNAARIVSQTNLANIGGRLLKNDVSVSPLGTQVGIRTSGTYTSPPTVTMGGPTATSIVHYTTDGTIPTIISPTYTGPVTLTTPPAVSKIVLNTVADLGAGVLGPVKTYAYLINPNMLSASASPAPGRFAGSINITLSQQGPGTQIWYTTDGLDPRTSSTKKVYSAPIFLSNNGLSTIKYVSVIPGTTPLTASALNIAYYYIGGERFARSEIDPSIEMPFSATDKNGLSVTTCWEPTDAMCLPAGPEVDLTRSVVWPRNFPTETFMWNATNVTTSPAGRAILVLALEGAYLSPTVVPGTKILFGRIRIRVDVGVAGHYRVTHPYGVDHFDVATLGTRAINFTEDIAAAQGNFDLFRFGRVGPILTWDVGAPAGYVGDPAIPHAVTGSPYNTNYFLVEFLNPATGLYQQYLKSDLFTVAGKIAPAVDASASPMGAFYSTPRTVSLTASDATAKIYFTLDGTIPTTAATVYAAEINIASTTTVKYFAQLADGTVSEVKTAVYTIDTSPLTLSVAPAGGTFPDAPTGTLVTLNASRSGRIFYTRDGTSPLISSTRILYSAPFILRGPASIVLKSVVIDDSNTASAEKTNTFVFTQVIPTATAPVGRFVAPSVVGAAGIPLNFTWSGSAVPGRVIRRYTLERSTNGGAFTQVALPLATSTSVSSAVSPGATYVYRVRATDSGFFNNTSLNATAPAILMSLAQENARSLKFAGKWATSISAGFSGGAIRSATRAGVSATFSAVNCSQIAWVSFKGPSQGIANVRIDGGPAIAVDLYAPVPSPATIGFVTNVLPVGTHTITIAPTGTRNGRSSGTQVVVDAMASM